MELPHVIGPSELDLQAAIYPVVANASDLKIVNWLSFEV
jgi:hypothetical protein